MNSPTSLLARLDAIGAALAGDDRALALIGLGSVGSERERLDAWSDLDFFVVAKEGHAAAMIEELDWLERVAPVAWHFRNTRDGRKLLFADGVFCEFAVFEPARLRQVPFAGPRIVWQADGFDEALAAPPPRSTDPLAADAEWQVGEALSNLYVGLLRWHRGEKLSAMRFIQHHAVDRVLALIAMQERAAEGVAGDPFDGQRRFEARYPEAVEAVAAMSQGYGRSRESARAVLEYLEGRFGVDGGIGGAIRELL